jgi:hypothetical protein
MLIASLLAAAPPNKDYQAIFLWSFVLIALLIVAFAGYSYLKKWMNSAEEPIAGGFTLSDMRELHRQGKMSTEEFEAARSKMVAAAKRMTDQMPAVTPRRTPPGRPGDPGSPPPPGP